METLYPLMDISFDNIGREALYLRTGQIATSEILGFAQMADDDLSVTESIHTHQIPGLR